MNDSYENQQRHLLAAVTRSDLPQNRFAVLSYFHYVPLFILNLTFV